MNPIDGDYVRDEILYGESYVPDELAIYIKRVFDEAPTIEAEVVKHGKWKLHNDGSGTCDQCHFTQKNVWDDDGWQNYCGVCGAKMDLEE